MYKVINNI